MVLPGGREQFALLGGGRPTRRPRAPTAASASSDLLGGDGRATGGTGEVDVLARRRRPRRGAAGHGSRRRCRRAEQRSRGEADALADLVEQFQRRLARPVPLVDDGDHRDAAVAAHLEQLQRLRLEALRGVDQHDGGVDRGQHAVGVLGEVGVAGGVDQVDHVVDRPEPGGAVVELQRGGADRDAAGLLHLHPVRHRRLAAGLAVDRAGLGDHLRVQRERLGERRLTGVGVRDHGEGAAARRLRPDTLLAIGAASVMRRTWRRAPPRLGMGRPSRTG